MTTNVDKRKVKRGKCNTCDACEEYEYVVGEVKSNCNYCGHTAPEHESLGTVGEISLPLNGNVLTDAAVVRSSTPNVILSPNVSAISFGSEASADSSNSANIEPGTQILTLKPAMSVEEFLGSVIQNSSTSRKNDDELNSDDIPLPENITGELKDIFVLKKEKPTDKSICAMAREVVTCLNQRGFRPTPRLLEKASKKALTRWSPLKVKGDTNGAGFAGMLKRRYDRILKNKPKTKTAARQLNADTLAQMQDDWEKQLRSPIQMKVYMDTLRESRLRVAIRQSASDHIRIYPALRLTAVLMHELESICKVPYTNMESNWYNYLPNIIQKFEEQGIIDIPENADNFVKTKLVLEAVHRCKIWYKEDKDPRKRAEKENDKKCRVLEVFPENTPLAETWSKNKDPPRLMAVENPEGGPSYHCFVDTAPLFAVNHPVQAMCLLIATFFAFNINWTPKAKFPLLFLVFTTVGVVPEVVSKVSNNSKYIKFLREIGVDV